MLAAQQVAVRPLSESLLQDVVRIHKEGLGYTLNSRLGTTHLGFLYETMARDSTSFVGVAMVEGCVAGIISGTLHEDRLKSAILESMSARQKAGLATRLLLRPWLMLQWLQSVIIALPAYYEAQEVHAVLTALAVDPKYQGRGVGVQLIHSLEAFFGANKVASYRLDTLATNHHALKFYGTLGFTEVARRAGSVILVRTMGQ